MHVEYLLSLLTDEQRVLFVPVTRVKRCEDLKLDSSTSAHTHTITHPCIAVIISED
jgi:hypothetical protein